MSDDEFEFPNNLMSVDQSRLRADAVAYLRSPKAKAMLADNEISFLTSIFICFVVIIAGLLLILTIKWSKIGVGLLVGGLTLAPIRERRSEFRRHPDRVKPLICHGVIMKGELGLVLGSLADPDHRQLASVAKQLGEIYTRGPSHANEKQIFDLLRDDAYHPQRRRKLPDPFSGYADFVLFDVQLPYGVGALSPYASTLHAFVTTEEDDGKMMQIPWDVVGDAVHFSEAG